MEKSQFSDVYLAANGDLGPPVGTGGELSVPMTSESQKDVSSTSSDSQEDSLKPRERDTWTNKIDFLLACIGFSVGLGNVWRFPYLCYKNGGGAFLIPYFICVALGGVPVFFLEVALGQFMSVGGLKSWNICPLFQGIGLATTIIVFLLNTYYNVILAWAFYYLFSSFTGTLPWSHCGNDWNTDRCKATRSPPTNGYGNHSEHQNETETSIYRISGDVVSNVTAVYSVVDGNLTHHGHTDPVTEFWERKVLQISSGVEDIGTVKWDLALCLLLAWIVVYFCIWKGVKSSGKVMYFTATSPYILMTVLLIRGVTLPGAIDGVKFYVVPDWERLLDAQVWVDAGTQIFFSYSISLGTLTALGSYNKFHHNCWKDSILFSLCNSGTSFFAGFVIFSVLGFMAKEQGLSVGEVAESGPGLAFIAYPKAVSEMPIAPLWSILFFIMVLLLGLDSQFVGVEGFVTAVCDMFPHQLHKGYRKELLIAGVCSMCFFIGLSMVTNGGMYVFQLFDYYSGSRIILLVAFVECVTVAWIYGVDRFYDNIQMMLGFRINLYMKISWMVTTPLFTLAMFGLCIYNYSELRYNRTYIYPRWAISMGWMLACSSVIMIPLVMIIKILRTKGSLIQRIRSLIRPKLLPHQLRPQDSSQDLNRDEVYKVSSPGPIYMPPMGTTEMKDVKESLTASNGEAPVPV